jgi:hypothetical protein
MKKTKYNLPGLPTVPSVPKATTKITPLRNSSASRIGGFNNRAGQPLNFGKASRAATRNPHTTSTWTKLLSGTTSGGIGGALSGVAGLSGGISSLISGLSSLIGGGKTAPPALVAYQLPTPREQTISTGSSVATPGVYGGPTPAAPFASQGDQIVQAVKQALLNSSSLNDVIAGL